MNAGTKGKGKSEGGMIAGYPLYGYEMGKGNADVGAMDGSWVDPPPPNALEVAEANARDDSSAEFVYGWATGLSETQECGPLVAATNSAKNSSGDM